MKRKESIFDTMFPLGLFGWRFGYIIFRPIKIVEEILLRIKWFFQRGFRGWDDRAAWSVDVWLSDILPPIIRRLKDTKMGVPFDFLPDSIKDGEEISAYRVNIGHAIFRQRLEELAVGIEKIKCTYDGIDPNRFAETVEKREDEYRKTMELLVKTMFSLWD